MGSSPKTIGKYDIVAPLGKGSMGVVYKGFDPMIGRFVAIKTIHPDAAGFEEGEIKQRFRREAQAAGRMQHPNIVSIYEYGEDEYRAYIAMEFVEGRSLAQVLSEERRLGLDTVVNIMLKLLSSLEYSHKMGVVHRDIKPANIMLTSEGEVKVTDFGIASLESSTLTRTGIMMGTPSYMAPEQLLGHKVDGRADIFAAGGLFYQLLTGERPFQGTIESVMHQVTTVTPEPPSTLNSTVPPAFDAVVAKAMAKRPEDRFQSAAEFRHAIEAVFYSQDQTRAQAVSIGAAGEPSGTGASAATQATVAVVAAADASLTVVRPPQEDRTRAEPTTPRWPLVGGAVLGLMAVVGAVLLVVRMEGPEPAPAREEPKVGAQPIMRQPSVSEAKLPAPEPRAEEIKAGPPGKEGVAPRGGPAAGDTFKDCPDCPELVVLAPGRFTHTPTDTGATGKTADPVRQLVSIGYPYAIGRYEVTRSQFAAFVAETGRKAGGCWMYDGQWTYREELDWRSPGFGQEDRHPVTCVSWLDAQAYVTWLSRKTGQAYRLPTSAEWQYASGVGSDGFKPVPGEREICSHANVADLSAEQQYAGWTVHGCRDGYVHTAPVGRYQPNSRGAHDMLGNVFEWAEDCWNDSLKGAPADGSAWLQGDCKQRVLHGGSWFTTPRYVAPGFRNHFEASYRSSSFGFRVARKVTG